MTDKEKEELDVLVDVIRKNVEAEAIYLFGSFAYGTPREDSDFDIYVVIPDDAIRPLDATQRIRFAISPFQKRPVDLLVSNLENFNKRKNLQSFVESDVFNKGVRLYA